MDWINDLRQEGEHASRLSTDLEYFASELLKIRPKAGSLEPFVFNPAQQELHRRLEEQKAKTGKVRAVILKARQMGISTYIAARFFRQTIARPGLRTAIIGHERAASRNLFGLVKRFHDHLPDDQKPSLGASNQEELIFDSIDSGYLVSVATLEGSGRSSTAQLLHASEAAFWASLQEQFAALWQTVPDIDGSEIAIETTGNQFGGEFHQFWRKAEAGESEFVPIFLPWSLDPSYRAKLPDEFAMTADEQGLATLHGLDAEQIMWRRNKISQLGSLDYFKREYPLSPDEAFLASQFDSFITNDLVMHARKGNSDIEPSGPLLIGVDPAGMGEDSTAVAWRQGHCITRLEKRKHMTTMEIAGWLGKIIRTDKPAKVSVDIGGLGVGVYPYESSGGMTGIVNWEIDRQKSAIYVVFDTAGEFNIRRKGNPSTLFGPHFIQGTLHDTQLSVERNVLQAADDQNSDRKGSDPNRSRGSSSGRTILGVFLFLCGLTIMKIAFDLLDAPSSPIGLRLISEGGGAVASLLIAQGTILILTPNNLRISIPFENIGAIPLLLLRLSQSPQTKDSGGSGRRRPRSI